MIGIIPRQMEPISRVSHLQRCCQRRRSRWPNSQRIGGDDRMSYRKAEKQTDPLMRLDLNKAGKFFVENGFHQDGQMQGRWMVKPRGTTWPIWSLRKLIWKFLASHAQYPYKENIPSFMGTEKDLLYKEIPSQSRNGS